MGNRVGVAEAVGVTVGAGEPVGVGVPVRNLESQAAIVGVEAVGVDVCRLSNVGVERDAS